MDRTLDNKIIKAVKWSSITEVLSKCIQPISNMLLARILAPDVFGVVATINIIVSFVDMFTDAGFQKYIIQNEFKDEEHLEKSLTVAFWTNLILSLGLWLVIIIFKDNIAQLVGSPGLGFTIVIACISLPLTSFSSLQIGYFKRKFDFKTLFFSRLIGILIPIFITLPLAFKMRTYWALVIGTILTNLSNAIILTYSSQWKPKLFYSVELLKDMFSFSIWSLIEQITIWLTLYIGTFIVGVYLSPYYIGMYKTSMTTVNQIMNLITSATTPILFSTLSRLQNNRKKFIDLFFKFQKYIAIIVLPMAVGIFMYRELITQILLGSQWSEATGFVGLWGLMSGIVIVFGYYSSEVYRSLGKPKLSVLSQVLHLIFLIPLLNISAKKSFVLLYSARSLARIQAIIVDMIIMWIAVKISPMKMIKNVWQYMIASILMGGLAYLLQNISNSMIWSFISIVICIIFYFVIICISKNNRYIIVKILKSISAKVNN